MQNVVGGVWPGHETATVKRFLRPGFEDEEWLYVLTVFSYIKSNGYFKL